MKARARGMMHPKCLSQCFVSCLSSSSGFSITARIHLRLHDPCRVHFKSLFFYSTRPKLFFRSNLSCYSFPVLNDSQAACRFCFLHRRFCASTERDLFLLLKTCLCHLLRGGWMQTPVSIRPIVSSTHRIRGACLIKCSNHLRGLWVQEVLMRVCFI